MRERVRVGRRAFLGAGLAGLPLLAGGWLPGGWLAADELVRPRLIQLSADPVNMEFPFASLSSFLTPTELFYIRNHYLEPNLDLKTWRLKVEGAVEHPLELSLEQVRKLKATTRPLTLECAGNGRSFLVPKAKGVPWGRGAVSTAEWTGIPLADVLDQAEPLSDAVDVILEGSDAGDPKKDGQPPGAVPFVRSLPLAKARQPEVLLAYGMNGADLTRSHGFPLRAVVGGWYGMASVKWLKRIVVTRRPYLGFDQTFDYAIWTREARLPHLTAITDVAIKSSIARPVENEEIPAGKPYRVHGAAWVGNSEVDRVEISPDGGRTWGRATLLGKAIPFCWRLWEYAWTPEKAGRASLLARATDRRGQSQPLTHDPNRRNYMISFLQPTSVIVRGA
jgi:DMSO/TMAO reductase YedYZ molybdopterin-dependent catalytic subunit